MFQLRTFLFSETISVPLSRTLVSALSITVLFTLSLLISQPTFARTVHIATGEYPPFCSSSARHYGFISHIITEALAREGYTAEFDFLPWKRALFQSSNGEYDATSWWVHSDERAARFLYSDSVVSNSVHFFYVKGRHFDFDWKTLSDLDEYRLGVTRGYFYNQAFTDYREAHPKRFDVVNSDEISFKRLLLNRIDLFPVNVVVGLELLRTRFGPNVIHQVTYHPRPLSSKEGFILFPKDNPDSVKLRQAFNNGLAALKADGTYDRMMDDLLSGYYSN